MAITVVGWVNIGGAAGPVYPQDGQDGQDGHTPDTAPSHTWHSALSPRAGLC